MMAEYLGSQNILSKCLRNDQKDGICNRILNRSFNFLKYAPAFGWPFTVLPMAEENWSK